MNPTEKDLGKDGKQALSPLKLMWRAFKYTALGVFLLFALLLGITLWDMPPMNDIENPQLDLSTRIYSADGILLGSIHGQENRVYTPLDSISPNVVKALLATEDIRFHQHSGIDPMSVGAIMKDLLLHFDLRGGSSISQQLARNLYQQVGRQASPIRKFKEAVVAIILESRFTKKEILQAYLNTTSFFGNTFGIEMGAQSLFNKSAKNLEMHEAALMVGLLKGPSYYNPVRYPERALNRRNTVLDQMIKYGYLEEAEGQKWKDKDLGLSSKGTKIAVSLAPYFKDQVKNWLIAWAASEGRQFDLYTDGLRVYTTIDSRMQRYAEMSVDEHMADLQKDFDAEIKKKGDPWARDKSIVDRAVKMTDRYRSGMDAGKSEAEIMRDFREKVPMRIWTWTGYRDTTLSPLDSTLHYLKFAECGFMAMDAQTGEIRAWVGGTNYELWKYDHVGTGKRQVGSTFKPIVYTAAIEQGLNPCDRVLDIPVTIDLPNGQRWTPSNSGGGDAGLLTYREGLAMSKNQVTAYVIKQIGEAVVCEKAAKMGIKTPINCVPAICLGVQELNLLEMVGAYGCYPNNGYYSEPYFISRIEDKYGNVLWERGPSQKVAMDSATAYTMVTMLQGVVDNPAGTAHRLRGTYHFNGAMAGKTGTTQENSDGWFIGFTPNLVAGAWVGFSDRRIHFRSTKYGQGAAAALPIWANFFKYILSDRSIPKGPQFFSAPPGYPLSGDCGAAPRDSLDPSLVPDFDL